MGNSSFWEILSTSRSKCLRPYLASSISVKSTSQCWPGRLPRSLFPGATRPGYALTCWQAWQPATTSSAIRFLSDGEWVLFSAVSWTNFWLPRWVSLWIRSRVSFRVSGARGSSETGLLEGDRWTVRCLMPRRAASLASWSALRFPTATGESPFWCPGQCTMASSRGSMTASSSASIFYF